MRSFTLLAALFAFLVLAPSQAALQTRPEASEVWQPAATPKGGVSWSTLESTKEVIRKVADGFPISTPDFPAPVRALEGKKIKVAGYMLPLQNGARQSHFVLLAYPADCPFHLNPLPTQFIEVRTPSPVAVDYNVITVEGTLQLTGDDEKGVFYRITDGRVI